MNCRYLSRPAEQARPIELLPSRPCGQTHSGTTRRPALAEHLQRSRSSPTL